MGTYQRSGAEKVGFFARCSGTYLKTGITVKSGNSGETIRERTVGHIGDLQWSLLKRHR